MHPSCTRCFLNTQPRRPMRSTCTPWSDVVLCKSFDIVSCHAGGKANGVGVRRRAERRAAAVAVCRRVGRLAQAYARACVKHEDSVYQYGVHSFMCPSHSLHSFFDTHLHGTSQPHASRRILYASIESETGPQPPCHSTSVPTMMVLLASCSLTLLLCLLRTGLIANERS